MLRENWRSLEFWHWWWGHRFPTAGKLALLGLLIAAVLAVGYFAASSVAGTGGGGNSSYMVEKTVRRVVTVREHGRVAVKTVPVTVQRTIVDPHTSLRTVMETQVVRRPVVHYVPVVRRRTVTVNGKRQVVTETRMVPTVKTETQVKTQTSTVDHTTTNTSTVHDTATQHDTTTQHVTTTQTVHDTATQTQTVTDTQTVHDTTTQTVTSPPDTVTITVTVPTTTG